MRDPNKATHNHLSTIGGENHWSTATEDEKESGVGVLANNNIYESLFDRLEERDDSNFMIGLSNVRGW